MDNELILFDRLNVIKDTINKYGEDNFYVSFSGGKDSTVVHYLVDMALPNNKIPRVYSNTGIEYNKTVEFVKKMAEEDERVVIIKPTQNIKQILEKYGYPFKSKLYSRNYMIYKNNKDIVHKYMDIVEENPKLLEDYDFIHNLPRGAKAIIKYIYNVREREREVGKSIASLTSPKCLKYQWRLDLNISDMCCTKLKEEPLKKWEEENNKPHKLLGLMREEGGRRAFANCKQMYGDKLSFSPLAMVSKEWEEWFIKTYDVKLADLYYPPYNFERQGCKGCPFNKNIQRELNTLEKFFPNERKQCERIWKPVYEEYRRIGYRLDKYKELTIDDFLEE